MASPKPRLLIIGGGFAGTFLAKKMSAACQVTLVDPKAYFEITWTTVRGIVDPNVAARSNIAYKDIPGIGRWVQATVSSLSAKEATLSTGEVVAFEYAAICAGSSYSDTFKSTTAPSREQRLEELKAISGEIQAAKSIVVVGGGPVGVETAAEIVEAHAGKALTLVHPGKLLLSAMPPKAGQQAQKWLEAHGVKVVLGSSVASKPEGRGPTTLSLSNGTSIAADMVLLCTGATPNTAFLAGGQLAGILDVKGAVKVLPSLQVEGQPHMFALGDCTNVPENKMGFLATKHAELVAVSLQTLIKAKPGSPAPKLGAWKPNMGNEMAILSLGTADGLCRMNGSVCTGCLPTHIKSKGLFIDDYRKQLGVAK